MHYLLSFLSPEEWQAVFAGLSFVTLLIGTVLAIRNLNIIRGTHELEAYNKFIEELDSTADDRRFVYRYHFPEKLEDIPIEDLRRLEKVVNSLNRIGLLMEAGILPPGLVFETAYPTIIR